MRIRFGCESCAGTVDALLPESGEPIACPSCGRERRAGTQQLFAREGLVTRCALCPSDDLYVQRDFPRRAGLIVMGLGALAFLVLAGGFERPLAGFAVLGGVVLLDLVLFRILPVVTVCYRCRTELRGIPPNPAHSAFDLHLAETASKRAAVDRANAV